MRSHQSKKGRIYSWKWVFHAPCPRGLGILSVTSQSKGNTELCCPWFFRRKSKLTHSSKPSGDTGSALAILRGCCCPQTLWLYCCVLWEGGHEWLFAVGGRGRSTSTSYETTALIPFQMLFLGNSGLVITGYVFRTAELLNNSTRRESMERIAMASVTQEGICFYAHEFLQGTKEDLSSVWVTAVQLLEDLEDLNSAAWTVWVSVTQY